MKVDSISEKMTSKGMPIFGVGLSDVAGPDEISAMLKELHREEILNLLFEETEDGDRSRPYKSIELPEGVLFEVVDLIRVPSEDEPAEQKDEFPNGVGIVASWKGLSVCPDPADPGRVQVSIKGTVIGISNQSVLALREFIDSQCELIPSWQDRQLEISFNVVEEGEEKTGSDAPDEPKDFPSDETVSSVHFPVDGPPVKRGRGRPRKTPLQPEPPPTECEAETVFVGR